jgi:hypothetical protein
MGVLLGFDPGGLGAFGWCIVEDAEELPLPVVAAGVGQDARDAFDQVVAQLSPETNVQAAGIDSPLFWTASDRQADQILRHEVKVCGAPSPGGTVQAVNSLRGACLVQGAMLGVLLRRRWPGLPISESHPKAYLWLTGVANMDHQPRSIDFTSLTSLFACGPDAGVGEHVRDAAIASLCAWALVHRTCGWRNLFLNENDPFSPIGQPLAYWMPNLRRALQHPNGSDC